MCGPLLAVVAPRGRRAVLHHAIRSFTYILLGLVAGAVGMGATSIGLSRAVSWTAAAIILAQAVAPFLGEGRARSTRIAERVSTLIVRTRHIARRSPWAGTVLLGVLNGLLPCGLVYSAMVAALGLGDVTSGTWFMAGFALGTSTVLAIATVIWRHIASRLPLPAYRLAPIALAAIALLLVMRGWTAGLSSPHGQH
jgi:sulfite exporter TauE/SafE